MKKTILLIFWFSLFFAYSNAQELEFDIVEDDAFVNSTYKTIYKKDRINDTYFFYYNKDATYSNRRYGLLKNGEKYFPDIFKIHQTGQSNTTVIFELTGIYGLFNLINEKWDIPLKYEKLYHLKNNVYKAKLNDLYGIVDANDNLLVDFKWKEIESIYQIENYYKVSEKNNSTKYGLLSLVNNKLTIPCEYNSFENDSHSNHFLVKKDDKYNLVDINNVPLFKNWYESIYLPSGGRKLFIVKLNNKMGIIDLDENIIVPIEYMDIKKYPYKDGSYLAQNKDGKYGFMSLDGRITLPFNYTNIESNSYGNSIIAMNDDKCGIVHVNDGIPYEVATCDYDNIKGNNQLFIVKKDGKYGMLDLYGKIITEIVYDNIENLSNSNNSYGKSKLYVAQKGEKFYFLNESGGIVNKSYYRFIKPLNSLNSYDNYSVDNSYIVVKGENNKYGLVDVFGKEIIPHSYDDILTRQDNFVTVQNKDKVGLYNIFTGVLVLPAEYDQIFLGKNNFFAKTGNTFYKIIIDDKAIVEKL